MSARATDHFNMKPLYKHEHEGIWFSKNGHKAYLRGEKPECLWPAGTPISPTVAHHIEIRRGSRGMQRRLVMFYVRVPEPESQPDPTPNGD